MWDAIVVGGGPAGSTSALLLARQGWQVLLLDREGFPRDKPCGEFLTPAVKPGLADLGVWGKLREAGVAEVSTVRLHAPSGRVAEYRPLDSEPAGYSLRRVTLDRILLNQARDAGVTVRESCAARALLRDDDQVVGVTTGTEKLLSRIVIGADGTHSVVARSLGVVRPLKRLQRVAIVSHWSGLNGPLTIEMRSSGPTVCGVGSLGGGVANVTIVAKTSEASRIAGRAADYLLQTIGEHYPGLAETLRSARCEPLVRTVGCFGHLTKRASGAGALLVGDAASFVDPFTGEGVYFGLRGAQIAAEVANHCLKSGDVSASSLYEYDRRRYELTQRYLLCGVVQAVVRVPALMERVVRRCGKEPMTLARLMEVLGDVALPSRVLQPRFAARLFR